MSWGLALVDVSFFGCSNPCCHGHGSEYVCRSSVIENRTIIKSEHHFILRFLFVLLYSYTFVRKYSADICLFTFTHFTHVKENKNIFSSVKEERRASVRHGSTTRIAVNNRWYSGILSTVRADKLEPPSLLTGLTEIKILIRLLTAAMTTRISNYERVVTLTVYDFYGLCITF